MKFAVMPIMEIRQTASMARTTVNVAPRAPSFGADIVIVAAAEICGMLI